MYVFSMHSLVDLVTILPLYMSYFITPVSAQPPAACCDEEGAWEGGGAWVERRWDQERARGRQHASLPRAPPPRALPLGPLSLGPQAHGPPPPLARLQGAIQPGFSTVLALLRFLRVLRVYRIFRLLRLVWRAPTAGALVPPFAPCTAPLLRHPPPLEPAPMPRASSHHPAAPFPLCSCAARPSRASVLHARLLCAPPPSPRHPSPSPSPLSRPGCR